MATPFDDQLGSTETAVSAPDNSSATPLRDSAAIKRLMEEVRCEETTVSAAAAYNRQHNRHNR